MAASAKQELMVGADAPAIDHGERAHSPWGASVAERFSNCPGCIRMSEGQPNETTKAAAEGTAAHELSERLLRSGKNADTAIGETLVVGNHTFEVDEEFAEHVQTYLDAVRDEYQAEGGDMLLIEERFDLSEHVYPGAFGTSDTVIWQPRLNRLVVIDLKFGKGYAVDVKDNLQLRYYALGALLKGRYPALRVKMGIVQPRAPHEDGPVRFEEVDILHLLDFKSELVAAIVATLDPDAPLNPGKWCTFCPAAGICPELRKQRMADAKMEFAGEDTEELSDDELAAILKKASEIEAWIKAVRREGFRRAVAGSPPPGQKLVAKRAKRYWVADDFLVAPKVAEEFDLPLEKLFEKKMISPARVEALLPSKGKGALKLALAEYVEKRITGYTLAPVTDKRPAVTLTGSAAADFGDFEEDE